MRYFSETIEGEELTNPDLEKGSSTPYNNPITIEWVSTNKNEKPKEKTLETLDNGSKIIKRTLSNDGSWHVYDNRDGTKRDITDDVDIDIPDDFEKTRPNNSYELVGIYHAFTPQEQEEYDDWKTENERKKEEAEAKQEFQEYLFDEKSLLRALVGDIQTIGTLGQYMSEIDQAITELYEAIPTNANTTQWHAVAKAYARRIKRGEITLQEVPESIREEVRRVLEEENK